MILVPLGYLKENYKDMFDPPLPIEKEKALNSISFGSVCKVFLEFENPLPKVLINVNQGSNCICYYGASIVDKSLFSIY